MKHRKSGGILPRPVTTHSASDDRAYCREVLPEVSRTFAINIRLLSGSMRDAVEIAYLLCRTADALEDSWPGEPEAIRERFQLFLEAIAGDETGADELSRRAAALGRDDSDIVLITNFPRVWRTYSRLDAKDHAVLAEGVTTLADGMRHYTMRGAQRDPATTAYLDTESELHHYCWIVAGCIGVMLTRLFGYRARKAADDVAATRRLDLSPVVGEALQLTNILLDWPKDVRGGRCYLPNEWLREVGLEPVQLVDRASPGVRELSRRLETLARRALARVPDYLDTIPSRFVRYRLFCLWPAMWAQSSLRHARLDPEFPWGSRRPKLPRGELWGSAFSSLLFAHRRPWLRRYYAGLG